MEPSILDATHDDVLIADLRLRPVPKGLQTPTRLQVSPVHVLDLHLHLVSARAVAGNRPPGHVNVQHVVLAVAPDLGLPDSAGAAGERARSARRRWGQEIHQQGPGQLTALDVEDHHKASHLHRLSAHLGAAHPIVRSGFEQHRLAPA